MNSLDEPTDHERMIGQLRGCLSLRPPDSVNFLLNGQAVLSEEDGTLLGAFFLPDLAEATYEA